MTSKQYSELASKLDTAVKEIRHMSGRVNALEDWKRAEDAYKSALKIVYKENEVNRQAKLKDAETKARTDLWIKLAWLIGIAGTIMFTLSQMRIFK